MLIRFNGTTGEQEVGCPVCGSHRKSATGFLETKYYVLPSGNHKVFRKGVPLEVSEKDGEYLLSHDWYYTDLDGNKIQVFEKIDE